MTDLPNAEFTARVHLALTDGYVDHTVPIRILGDSALRALAEHVARQLLHADEVAMLRHALELTAEAMASTPDDYTAANEAALESLRALVEPPEAPLSAAPVTEDGLCGAREAEPRSGTSPCVLPAGHPGPYHEDHWTNRWRLANTAPATEDGARC